MKQIAWGLLLEKIGFILFALLFWWPLGFHLGGDPFFLDKYSPTLNLAFPYFGVSLMLLLLSVFLQKKNQQVSENQILVLLLFLAIMAFTATQSIAPKYSIIYIILWSIALFGIITGQTFWLDKRWKQITLLLGITLGTFVSHFSPLVSLDLLGIAALYGLIFLKIHPVLRYSMPVMLFYFSVIALTQNYGLILLTLVFWLTAFLWLPRSRRMRIPQTHYLWIVFLIVISLLGSFILPPTINTEPLILSFFDHILWGTGEGTFLQASFNQADHFIFSQSITPPASGMTLTLLEQGSIGFLAIVLLSLMPWIFNPKRYQRFPIFLFLGCWLVSPVFIGTPNGILMALPLLFMHKKDG